MALAGRSTARFSAEYAQADREFVSSVRDFCEIVLRPKATRRSSKLLRMESTLDFARAPPGLGWSVSPDAQNASTETPVGIHHVIWRISR